jgi:hypothetical protein
MKFSQLLVYTSNTIISILQVISEMKNADELAVGYVVTTYEHVYSESLSWENQDTQFL